MLLDADESQLVLVDYQPRLMPCHSRRPRGACQCLATGAASRSCCRCRVGHARRTRRAGRNPAELRALCRKTLAKMHFSAVADGLARAAAARPRGRSRAATRAACPSTCRKRRRSLQDQRNTIVLAGCEAHVCLLQTALDLLEEEFDVWVVTDACGSRTERNRDAAFDRLAGAGAELVTTEMVAFEWLRTAEHPSFQRSPAPWSNSTAAHAPERDETMSYADFHRRSLRGPRRLSGPNRRG